MVKTERLVSSDLIQRAKNEALEMLEKGAGDNQSAHRIVLTSSELRLAYRKLRHGVVEATLATLYYTHYPEDLPSGIGLEGVQWGFIHHDIGSIKLGDAWSIRDPQRSAKTHVDDGLRLLSIYGKQVPEVAYTIIECHHERLNGEGPAGLKGEEIPSVGRLAGVIDSLVSPCEWRPYGNRLTLHEAWNALMARPQAFDQEIVRKFGLIFNELTQNLDPSCLKEQGLGGLHWLLVGWKQVYL